MAGHIKQLDSGRWQARHPRPGGRGAGHESRNIRTKKEAEDWLTDQRAAAKNGMLVDRRDGKVTFGEVAKQWLEGRLGSADETVKRDRSILHAQILPTFGNKRIDAITSKEILGWVKKSSLSPETVHRAVRVMSMVFDLAVAERRMVVNPARDRKQVPLPRIVRSEPRFLDVASVQKLADAIDPRYRKLVLVTAATGLRWSEVIGLRMATPVRKSDVDIAAGRLTVNGQLLDGTWKPLAKSEAGLRSISISPSVVELFKEQMLESAGREYVFTAPGGGPLLDGSWRQRFWNPAVRAVGFDGLHFHDLRHSHAAQLIESGIYMLVISRRLGHSKIDITMDRYGHLMAGLDERIPDPYA